MVTPSEVIDTVASLMNDTAQTVYTDTAVLPYLNMALRKLQEEFELNNIPVTNQTSAVINIPEGVTTVRFARPGQEESLPALPVDLIEIQQLWESQEGQNNWIPMTRQEFLPHQEEDGQAINQFLVWAWIKQEIKLIAANTDIDLKIDYVASMFRKVEEPNLNEYFPFLNIHSYLGFKTAEYCSRYIGENPERANSLQFEAKEALDVVLGISTKGRQATTVRRRPFRGGWKRSNLVR